jgi:hypothetical protein
MSRNGSGTYSLPAGNPVVTGTTISSTWANNTLTDIATALTGSLAADGQTTATGNLKMGNNRVTGLADAIASTDGTSLGQVNTAISTAISGISANYLVKASNLSDVANATTARGNLTAAKSGANSDITSLTGLTTPLTVAQGGTGAATLTANNVLLGNGTSAPQVVAPSTSGNVLTSNGTTWVSSSPSSVNYTKAWVTFDGATPSIFNSFNIASITKNGTGDYTIAFTTALANANYAVTGNATINAANNAFATVFPYSNPASPFYQAPTTASFRIMTSISNVGGGVIDPQRVAIVVTST